MPWKGAPMLRLDHLDPDDGYLLTEALCLVHRLTFHAGLAACPICQEAAR